MADLEDDIARIARLRGRDAGNYQRSAVGVEAALKKVSPHHLRGVFFAPPDQKVDISIYDALPFASRVFIREAPVHISALHYSELLETVGSQSELIGLLSAVIPWRIREVVCSKYGKSHPQAEHP